MMQKTGMTRDQFVRKSASESATFGTHKQLSSYSWTKDRYNLARRVNASINAGFSNLQLKRMAIGFVGFDLKQFYKTK